MHLQSFLCNLLRRSVLHLHRNLGVFSFAFLSVDKAFVRLVVKLNKTLNLHISQTAHSLQQFIGLVPCNILVVLSEGVIPQRRNVSLRESQQIGNVKTSALCKKYSGVVNTL